MKNPFRSEAEAFRFLLGAVVYFAAGLIGLIAPPIAILMFLLLPLAWVVPTLLDDGADDGDEAPRA